MALKPWKAGESGNPTGRPKGSRNKLGEAFLQDLHSIWQRKGAEVLERVAEEDPAALARMVASILPKELNVNHSTLQDLTDEQLAALDQLLAEISSAPDPGGDSAPSKTAH